MHSPQVTAKIVDALPLFIPASAIGERTAPGFENAILLELVNTYYMPVKIVNGSKPFTSPGTTWDQAFVWLCVSELMLSGRIARR
jgi:hypothetical protein